MNKLEKTKHVSWRKYIWLILILLVAGISYAQPELEKWIGVELPSLNGGEQIHQDEQTDEFDSHNDSKSKSAQSRNSHAPQTGPSKANPDPPSFHLTPSGRNQFLSPAGLIYTMGPRGEHRIDHIMRHAKDDPSRPVHSVFEGDRDTILKIIDEGYELVKSRSHRVKSSRDGNRAVYIIDMRKKIGYEGGQSGKRKRFPALKHLKLILQNKNGVVTAFPFR